MIALERTITSGDIGWGRIRVRAHHALRVTAEGGTRDHAS
jgi:hypothetical protein